MNWRTEPIEPVPKPKSLTCKLTVYAITIALHVSPWLAGFWAWKKIDITVGAGIVLFGYIVVGVISSKMRQLSVPLDQREISFSTYELVCWFVSRYLFCEKEII